MQRYFIPQSRRTRVADDELMMNFSPRHFRIPNAKATTFAIWSEALAGVARFYRNKFLHGFRAPRAPAGVIPANEPVRHARVAVGGANGDLPYCIGRDARGITCAVQPAWMYLRDLGGVGVQKDAIIRRLLAQLTGGITYHFAFHIDLPDAAIVRRAFASAGFKVMDWDTFTYAPPAGHADLIDTFSGKSIKGTLRRARRDLEIIDISARDYFRFQRANLAASGKKNTRNDNLDQLILDEALRRGCARIVAARRRPTDAHPGPHPIDAAAVLLWEEASGVLQFWRLTYREHSYGPLPAHVDATKLLVLAAMQEAADRKMILDTDGYTSGMAKIYGLFGPGVFQLASRLHCERECLWAILLRYYPSVARRIGEFFPGTAAKRPAAQDAVLQG